MLLKYVRYSFLLLLTAWAIFNLKETVHYVLADYSQVPVYDFWRIPQLWANPHAIHWSNLWEQHNEHRIVFPELIDVADMLLLHGRMYLPIAVSGAFYLGIWIVLAWTVYSQRVLGSPWREAALLLAAVVIFWKGCSTVIATPFQLQFTMLQLFSVLALLFMTMLVETTRNRYLAAVVACGVISTYSSSNGMLIWVILIFAGRLRSPAKKLGSRQMSILCAAAVVFIGAYFFRYRFLPSMMSTNIRHPFRAAAFLCSYFSMPFGGSGPRALGFGVGALNLLAMAVCFVVVWRRGLMQSRLGVVVFGSYLFILISALLTTAGRMILSDYQFAQAKAWRYVTMPTVSWALVSIALVWAIEGSRSRHCHWSWAVLLGVAVCFFLGFRKADDWVEGTRLDLANAQITATMFRNGVFDANQVRTIFPNPDFVHRFLPALRQFHKSIYIHGDDKWVGRNLLSLPLQKAPIIGKITRVYPVPGGLEIFGWADTNSLTDDHEILFVNGQMRIVGFGRRPAAGMPTDLSTWDTPKQLAFVGYVSLANPVDKISVYVNTFHGSSIRPMDSKIDLPAFAQLENQADTAALPGIAWLPEANWTIGGYNPEPENGPAPPGVIYGSWSAGKQRTGFIRTAPFAKPSDNCLVLPLSQGRASYGQSVEVRDADSSQVIAELPFLDGRTIWKRWRIPIPASTRNLTIVANDQGTGPNQWLALATPEQCP